MTVSSPSCPTTAPPRTMSRSPTTKWVRRSTRCSLRRARTPVSPTRRKIPRASLTCNRRHCSHCYGRGGLHRCQGGPQVLDLLRWTCRLSAGVPGLSRTPVKSLAEKLLHLDFETDLSLWSASPCAPPVLIATNARGFFGSVGIYALPCVGTLYDMTTSPRYIPTAMIQKVTMLCKRCFLIGEDK
jgi:hypothetical protein